MSETAAGRVSVYTIQQLASEFSLTARTLRFYEDKGLIAPGRRGQRRIYTARDRARLGRIVQGRQIGLTLDEIGDLLDTHELNPADPVRLRASLAKLQASKAGLEKKRDAIAGAINDLGVTCDLIEGWLNTSQH